MALFLCPERGELFSITHDATFSQVVMTTTEDTRPMADEIETADDLLDAGAETQTGEEQDGQADTTTDNAGGTTEERFTEEAPDPNDPQYKKWQAAYTRSRQKDRERYGKMEGEHKQYGDVLRNFYQSDEYALQVLRQRFPALANKLTLDGPASQQTQGTRTSGQATSSQLASALEERLGPDLAFLAPRLGPVLEEAIHAAIGGAIRPIQERTEQQQAAARKAEEDSILEALDGKYPGWEAKYSGDMQELDAFLNSDRLKHPKFGSKHEIMLRIVNPDLARIDAARAMERSGRSRLTTGRSGAQVTPNIDDKIRHAKSDSEAFRLAAEAAMQELRRGA